MMLTELQYFGTISYIKALNDAQYISFDKEERFTKMGFKNRTIIASAQGPLNLTIPIVGGRDQKNRLQDILIDYSTGWQSQHIKSIQTCYKRAPFFEYYEQGIKDLLSRPSNNLFDFLVEIQQWVKLQCKNSWTIQEDEQDNNASVFRDPYFPKNYQEYPNPIKYQQVFEVPIGFIPNLSILDVLFCCGGKQTQQLLKSS
jgi:hypothetical protein